MSNRVRFWVGGDGGAAEVDGAADYTKYVVRASYTKIFCDDYTFDLTCSGINAADGIQFADFAIDKNVFIGIDDNDDGEIEHLLFKGVIEDVTWTSKKSVQVRGKQAKRKASGGKGQMHTSKVPEWCSVGNISVTRMINGTAWFLAAKSWKDDGTTGEAGGPRPS